MYRIAIPKGALLKKSIEYLAKQGITFEMVERKLLFQTNNTNVEILIVRPTDVAVYTEKGAVDIGILGSDVLNEYEPKVLDLMDLNYGECSLQIASPNSSKIKTFDDIPNYCRVATKFVNTTKKFFRSKGIIVEVIPLYGSIEIAPLTGLSDIIVDLVGTGKTLKENGLTSIHTISNHSAHFIVNKTSWQLHNSFIKTFLTH